MISADVLLPHIILDQGNWSLSKPPKPGIDIDMTVTILFAAVRYAFAAKELVSLIIILLVYLISRVLKRVRCIGLLYNDSRQLKCLSPPPIHAATRGVSMRVLIRLLILNAKTPPSPLKNPKPQGVLCLAATLRKCFGSHIKID